MAPESDWWKDVDQEYDFIDERERFTEYQQEQEKEIERRIERRIKLDELRMRVDELKAQLYEEQAIDRTEHRLLERFEHMFRGRWISEPLAMRMIEIIRDRMSRSPSQAMEKKMREAQAEQYLLAMKKYMIKGNNKIHMVEKELDGLLKEKEFIEKGEFEL